MNIGKTNFVLIVKNQHADNVRIILDDSEVTQRSHVKFLGITIDERLDWHAHINHCQIKPTSSLFALRNARACINENIAKTLYYTLIYPFNTWTIHIARHLPFTYQDRRKTTVRVYTHNDGDTRDILLVSDVCVEMSPQKTRDPSICKQTSESSPCGTQNPSIYSEHVPPCPSP